MQLVKRSAGNHAKRSKYGQSIGNECTRKNVLHQMTQHVCYFELEPVSSLEPTAAMLFVIRCFELPQRLEAQVQQQEQEQAK